MDDVAKETIPVIDVNEDSQDLKSIPPGFSRGLQLPGDEREDDILSSLKLPARSQQDDNGVLLYTLLLAFT